MSQYPPCKSDSWNESESESLMLLDDTIQDYQYIVQRYGHLIKRSYEGCKWYFIVYNPLDKPYSKDLDWFLNRALDSFHNKIYKQSELIITTRECATKWHINQLVVSKEDLTLYNGKVSHHKSKIYAVEAKDRYKVFEYIFKDSKKREFKLYEDYKISDRGIVHNAPANCYDSDSMAEEDPDNIIDISHNMFKKKSTI